MDYDLGEKFEHYRQIPSLSAVLYVWQDRRQVELRERANDDWSASIMGPGTSAAISSLGVSIDVNALYADAGALS
jgi:Uma2 family endonuclease